MFPLYPEFNIQFSTSPKKVHKKIYPVVANDFFTSDKCVTHISGEFLHARENS